VVPAIDDYVAGVLAGSRAMTARAITLVESTRPDHRQLAQELLVRLTPHAGGSRRVGVTGVPGVGKSTFIDALGSQLTAAGRRVAVLAVDPSSTRSGGSILGDKTRMSTLATDPAAFIRPSPTAGTLGGVTKATREAIVVVEAAGYDVVIVETVGVGQSETAVAEMVDTFVLLALARTGDQLQGIKKGVLELVDVVAVNKADGPHAADARTAASELRSALRLLRSAEPRPPTSVDSHDTTTPEVLTCSARERTGLAEVWERIERHHDDLASTGELDRRRRRQQVGWMWAMVRDAILERLHNDAAVAALAPELERAVLAGTATPATAAQALLAAFRG
jgi:LAO/AO transport system kinase